MNRKSWLEQFRSIFVEAAAQAALKPPENRRRRITFNVCAHARGFRLHAVALALPLQAAPKADKSLYERLGGVFSATKPGKTHLGLEQAHRDLKISPTEFDEFAAELGRSLDFAKVPAREQGEVLAAFAAHKKEVTAGYKASLAAD